ncbi:response regulator [Bradymonadaceae bacterium TMQ3]|uniref:Response regulator n=1 Tax=Lujinxingia sediminis TaxID=2480984 RepID=A0ABM7YGE1_9DELT|nr:response regulator [Lujinxingia sediminis]RDV39747.1 response regulator [Bradymonadaceae bacterium TMQ3]RVU48209.1 response regulator [Lujinxingia sediminis]TXC77510.1 response regulator [Bradymonadales bacterium TMQ1]
MTTGQMQAVGRQEEADASQRIRTKLAGRCVLLVEDDEAVRTLIALLLKDLGVEVVELGDGIEALNYVAASEVYRRSVRRPDLIVADINMPNFSGLDLLMGLRESRVRPPVVLVTAVNDEDIQAEARRLGAVSIVQKPFEVDELLGEVAGALLRAEQNDEDLVEG